jgi:hypothetical protein
VHGRPVDGALVPVRRLGGALGSPTTLLVPLAFVGAGGLLVVAVAFMLSRSHPGSGWAQLLFWAGLGLIVVPAAARLFGAAAGRGERAGLLVVVGALLYLVKVIHDPFGFTFADEWVHVYNVERILRTGSLFNGNPILPVTARYPGLESVTAAVASLTHLSIFASGVIVVGAARLLFVLALFLLLEAVSGSARVAGAAGVVYMTNPNFLFWGADFSYESIALPLALFAVLAVVRGQSARGRTPVSRRTAAPGSRHTRFGLPTAERAAWAAVALLATSATVMSHHLTSFALAGFLVLTCLIASLRRSNRRGAPWLLAAFAVAMCAVWVYEVAPGTGEYLLPVLAAAFHETVATILGHSSGRSLFGGGSAGQQVAPLWQRLVALASVGLIVAALPFGLLEVRRRYLRNPFVIVLAAAAIAYVAVLPMRLVPNAWETSNRSSEFLFVGLALTLALVRIPRSIAPRLLGFGISAYLGLLLIGGVVAGWPPRDLLALPIRGQAAGEVTVVPQPQAVAEWARSVLGPGHRFIAPEAVGRELLVSGGQTAFVTSAPFDAATVLEGDTMTSGIVDTLAGRSIGYVAEDTQASGNDNMTGYFFASPGGALRADPLALDKFDSYPGIDRLLDSGDIVIYDVREFLGAP